MDVNTANQSTTDEQMMDILLVLDKEKKTISAVKGVDENGGLQIRTAGEQQRNPEIRPSR